MQGAGVAWRGVIYDDHRSALSFELEPGGESGSRSADDRDIADPFDVKGGMSMVIHGLDGTDGSVISIRYCDIRKNRPGGSWPS